MLDFTHLNYTAQGIEAGLFQPRSRVTMEYMNDLAVYTSIMAPIARSIKSLESRAANAADVFIFWLAIAASLRDLFSMPPHVTGITSELAGKITKIVNRRYKEFIDNSPTDLYFAAFFLDPRVFHPFIDGHLLKYHTGYVRSDVLKRPTTMGHTITVPPMHSDPSPPQVPYLAAFIRTKEFLKVLLKPLCAAKHEFIMNIGVKRAMKEMVRQLELYARGEGPFASPPRSDTLSWWRALSESCDANVLAVRLGSLAPELGSLEMTVPCNQGLFRDGKFNGR